MNCAEVKKWRIILGEEERETILQALGKMLFTASFLQSALYSSAPQWGAGRASALQDSYREGEPLLGKCLASCCSTEMGFYPDGSSPGRRSVSLAGGRRTASAPREGEVSPAPGSAQLQAPSADAQSHYSPPAEGVRPVRPSMANSSLQGSREPLFCGWQEPRGLSTGITGDLALKYLHLPSKLQAFPRSPHPQLGRKGSTLPNVQR